MVFASYLNRVVKRWTPNKSIQNESITDECLTIEIWNIKMMESQKPQFRAL